MFVTRNVWMKYHSPTNGEGNDLGGGTGEGTGDGAGDGEGGAGDDKGGSGEGAGDGDGKKTPTDSEAKLIKEVMEKKAKLKEANDAKLALEQRLRQFDGIDPEAVREMMKSHKDKQTKELEERGEWTRLKAQMVEEHGKEKKTLEERVIAAESASAQLQATIAELTVGNSFAQSQFIRDELALTSNKARVVYGSHFEFKDGQVVAYDKPTGSAQRTPLVDASGEPLAFEAALKKIVDADPDREQLLKSKVKSGAGSKTSQRTSAPDTNKQSSVSGIDRIAAALATSGGIGDKK